MSSRLQCISCTRSYPWTSVRNRCDCGGLLDVVHSFEGSQGKIERKFRENRVAMGLEPAQASGVWSFSELIYPFQPGDIASRAEGNTPLLSHPAVRSWTGIDNLWLKVEGENPTGSFKDRGMTVAVTHALNSHQRALACASTGNTAASLAAYGALAGIPVLVFVPAGKISRGKLAQAVAYGASVVEVNGDFDAALRLVQTVCEKLNVALLNSINPYRIEGQKSAAFEIIRDFGGSAPDWIILPAGNLGNISAYGKALHELHEIGLLEKLPKLAGIQAEGANPFYRSYQDGFAERHEVKAKTVATAIRIGAPASYERAIRSLRWTNGVVEQVSDAEILEAKKVVDGSGIGCEPASAASVAGARKLRDKGVLQPDETVVAVLTGHLLKDPDIILRHWQPGVRIQPNESDAVQVVSHLLERKLSEVRHA